MGYVYAVLWLVVGMILIFKMGRENKSFYAVGGFFVFWGIWQTLDQILEVDLYSGIYGWIHKIIAVAALALCLFIVYLERKRSSADSPFDKTKSDNSDEEDYEYEKFITLDDNDDDK